MTERDENWFISDILKMAIAFVVWLLSCLQVYISYASVQKRIMHISLVVSGIVLIPLYANAHNAVISLGWQAHVVMQSLSFIIQGSMGFLLSEMLSRAVGTAVQRASRRKIDTSSMFLWIRVLLVIYNCFVVAGTAAMLATNRQAYSSIRFTGAVIVGIGCGYNICRFVLMLKGSLRRMAEKSDNKFSQSFSEANPHVFSGDRLQRLQLRLTKIFVLVFTISVVVVAGAIRISYSSISKDRTLTENREKETENYTIVEDLEYFIFILLNIAFLYYCWTPVYRHFFPSTLVSSGPPRSAGSQKASGLNDDRKGNRRRGSRSRESEDIFNNSGRPMRPMRPARGSTVVSMPHVTSPTGESNRSFMVDKVITDIVTSN
mmetsp:Transcript_18206/g.27325  ORF Transcript_18206/g.27325 Transcript_18206/m.27325 type:complete len:375 (+) Transcript_18206:101-1225(+)